MKIVLITFLTGAAGVVWVPNVRNVLSGQSSSPAAESDSGMDATGDASPTSAIDVGGSATKGTAPVPVSTQEDMASQPEEAQTIDPAEDPSLKNFGTKRRSFFSKESGTSDSNREDATKPVPAMSRIRLWMVANPLTGVMQSPKGHRAIFGGGAFREGDATADGWIISQIRSEAVDMEAEGLTFTTRLPRLGQGMTSHSSEDTNFGDSPISSDNSTQASSHQEPQ